jgi:hypothetical protein
MFDYTSYLAIYRFPLEEIGILDTSLKLIGRFCLYPNLPKKEIGGEKEFCFFFLFHSKREGRLGAQVTQDTKWLKSEYRDCWVGRRFGFSAPPNS